MGAEEEPQNVRIEKARHVRVRRLLR